VAGTKKFTGSPSPTEVGNWNNQIVPRQTQVSSPASTTTGDAATGIGVSEYAKTLYNMTAAERKVLGQALKNAGYRVNTNGVYSTSLVTAYTTAVQTAQFDAQQLGQTFNDTFFKNFLTRETAARGGTGDGGPKIVEQKSVITDSDAKDLIDAVIRDKLQRKASQAEIDKYTAILQRKAAKQPTITKTEKIGGKTVITPTPGFGLQEAQSFLLDKVAGTDEAKANKVLGYYETFMNALGGR
jgi:hypothetical protein